MTLLNGILALGALAFTVPLAIHLLFRSRFKTIDWGAMHLLQDVVRINRRRIQLLQLLLLLLRCLVPVLLAFCLARPVLTGFRVLPGDAPQTLVLAVDDSRSMSARNATGISRMDRVKGELSEMLAGLSRRDEVILIRSSQLDAPPATRGAQNAMRQLREVTAQTGPFEFGRLVRAAVEATDQASYPRRHIVLVSDFQSHVVNDATTESLSRLAKTLEEKSIRPLISFLNLGGQSNELSNVSVDEIEVDSPAVVAGRGTQFSARLRNASDAPVRDLRVVWSIDGIPLTPRTLSIPPRSTITSRLNRRIDAAGVHELACSVEHGDALIADNRRSIAVEVIREIDVMLVDGRPSNRPLEGETDFLAIALSPFAFGGEDQPDAVRTTVVRDNRLAKELQDVQPDIVVLANVASFKTDAKRALAQFVDGGGGLVIFDGDAVKTEAYNSPWAAEGSSWTLPARLGDFVGTETSKDAPSFPIGDLNEQYVPWQVLGSADQQPFGQVDIYGYRKLAVDPSVKDTSDEVQAAGEQTSEGDSTSALDSAANRLLSMANGDPLVVSARRGRGQVVQFAVPCDSAWTTLPMRLVYLPMMQQLVLDLAGSRKQTTIDIGGGFSVPTSELASLLPDDAEVNEDKPPTFTIQPPNEPESAVKPTDEAAPQLFVSKTFVPGNYRIRQTTPIKDAAAVVTSTLRVVEVPAIESQLRDADPSRLEAAATSIDANLYSDLSSLQSDDRLRRYGREIWRWLLAGLLVVLVTELLLEQRSTRSRVVGAS